MIKTFIKRACAKNERKRNLQIVNHKNVILLITP